MLSLTTKENAFWLTMAIMLSVCVSEAWLTRYSNRAATKNWKDIQLEELCSKTGEDCLQSNNCCSESDVCLLDKKTSFLSGRRVGYCRDINMFKLTDQPIKYKGAECNTSGECDDMCCRIVPRHIYGTSQECGSKEGFMCV
ncbi:uncharacterized protein LOC132557607 [Ylistrum balloti]|uniref:uncharacterized protein LOC132557607 n=1 Tax=Ylistrum balloti TaxID=509963 RepID=UPI002905C609|nr:uncharacterized protein LOC132557607 [Ylistrum balloti]